MCSLLANLKVKQLLIFLKSLTITDPVNVKIASLQVFRVSSAILGIKGIFPKKIPPFNE